MDISLIFSVILRLNFTVQYVDNGANYQDYFLFSGENCSLHLFRENSTIFQVFSSEDDNVWYEAKTNDSSLQFTWPLSINNIDMDLVKGREEIINHMTYSSFMFIDPLTINRMEEKISVNEQLPYDLIAGILTIFIVIVKLPEIIMLLNSRIRKTITPETWV